MARRLRGVVDDNLTEVIVGAQDVGRENPCVNEVLKVSEPVELFQAFDGLSRERKIVSPCDLQQSVSADGSFEVYMELDLGHDRRSHAVDRSHTL